jgi:hypothetical protein
MGAAAAMPFAIGMLAAWVAYGRMRLAAVVSKRAKRDKDAKPVILGVPNAAAR